MCVLLAAALSAAGASSALAADSSVDCGGASAATVTIPVTVTLGSPAYTISNSSGSSLCYLTGRATSGVVTWTTTPASSTNPTILAASATLNVSWLTTGTQTLEVQTQPGRNFNYVFTVTSGGGSPSSSAASSEPPRVFQQFGKPLTGTCDSAAPATLNWAGVMSGGWGESWAQWMNGGKGGAVCTRMLVYSSSRGAWTVG